MSDDLAPGPDGQPRCAWALSAPEYIAYHDEEWGRPIVTAQGLYERLTLEAFQSGLAWITILRKREGFRRAFAGFDPATVARFDDTEVTRLMADPGIVRNWAKIEAAIANARVVDELGADFPPLVWGFADPRQPRPRPGERRTTTPSSVALAAALRAHGVRFVGPVTAYALMQACGLVDDHVLGCVIPPPSSHPDGTGSVDTR